MLQTTLIIYLDKTSLESVIKEKERLIVTLNRQINDLNDEVKNKEREFRSTLQKLTDDEKQRSKGDKFEIDGLKDKNNDLEQKLIKQNLKMKKDTENLELSNDRLEKEIRITNDENRSLKIKITDLSREIETSKKISSECKTFSSLY